MAGFRTAENNSDFVGFIEAAFTGDKDVNGDDDRQQYETDHDDKQQRSPADFVPDAIDHRFAERRVDHQQNRGLIRFRDPLFVARDPVADPRARQVSQHKRQQQLQHNFAHLFQTALRAMNIHYQTDQQRRQENAQQTGRRR